MRILIVADNPLARAGLAAILSDLEHEVLAEVGVDASLPQQVMALAPDIVVWDLGWETRLDLLGAVQSADYSVVALLADESQVALIWTAGVRGVLSRDIAVDVLGTALDAVAQGLLVIDPALGMNMSPVPENESDEQYEPLTPRELEVLKLLAEGFSNKAIAHQLSISDHTVKFHVNAIMTKLHARSRTEAAMRAARLGLIAL